MPDRGRVLADTAVLIADSGRVLSDLVTLRDQGELFGSVASDPTLWRALEAIGPTQRDRIARARATTRAHVGTLIGQRHGRIPPSRVGDRDLGKTIVIRRDASILISHSDQEQAAGTVKHTDGHHPLTAWCDNTSESLAFHLRPGNAGSNTATDHIMVLTAALAQIPARHRRDVLVTVDGTGATGDLVKHITTRNAAPGRRVHYSVGFDVDERARTTIATMPQRAWTAVSDTDGNPHDLDDAGAVELTGLLREHPPGGVPRTVELPANVVARVRTTSLLGEKFVDLAAPTAEPPQGTLADGDRIPLARTSRATDVEEVLGALSLLLNGGGIDQIRTIATELNAGLAGHEPQLRALLADLNTLVSVLDARKAEINRALDALNRLSATLAARREQIATALDGLAPGLAVLADQRTQLTSTVQALDRLSVVATDTINRSRDNLLADLQLLRPTLQQLANAGQDLPGALQLIVTYPFTDGAAREAFKGDYANLYVRADLNLSTVLDSFSASGQPLKGVPPQLGQPLGPLLGPLLRSPPQGSPS
ncbi:MAG: MCE family protein [Pseudonocardiaceae bacterium]